MIQKILLHTNVAFIQNFIIILNEMLYFQNIYLLSTFLLNKQKCKNMLQSLSCMTLNSITVTRLNFFVHVIDLKKKVFCIFQGFHCESRDTNQAQRKIFLPMNGQLYALMTSEKLFLKMIFNEQKKNALCGLMIGYFLF